MTTITIETARKQTQKRYTAIRDAFLKLRRDDDEDMKPIPLTRIKALDIVPKEYGPILDAAIAENNRWKAGKVSVDDVRQFVFPVYPNVQFLLEFIRANGRNRSTNWPHVRWLAQTFREQFDPALTAAALTVDCLCANAGHTIIAKAVEALPQDFLYFASEYVGKQKGAYNNAKTDSDGNELDEWNIVYDLQPSPDFAFVARSGEIDQKNGSDIYTPEDLFGGSMTHQELIDNYQAYLDAYCQQEGRADHQNALNLVVNVHPNAVKRFDTVARQRQTAEQYELCPMTRVHIASHPLNDWTPQIASQVMKALRLRSIRPVEKEDNGTKYTVYGGNKGGGSFGADQALGWYCDNVKRMANITLALAANKIGCVENLGWGDDDAFTADIAADRTLNSFYTSEAFYPLLGLGWKQVGQTDDWELTKVNASYLKDLLVALCVLPPEQAERLGSLLTLSAKDSPPLAYLCRRIKAHNDEPSKHPKPTADEVQAFLIAAAKGSDTPKPLKKGDVADGWNRRRELRVDGWDVGEADSEKLSLHNSEEIDPATRLPKKLGLSYLNLRLIDDAMDDGLNRSESLRPKPRNKRRK